jgi:hypothetical protein
MTIILGIYGEIYEVSKFKDKHPGEGIHDTYLKYYNRKDATVEFNRFHYTNESDEMLIESKKIGEGEETGIIYVCPYFFKKNIPKYFHFSKNENYDINFFKSKSNDISKKFILCRNKENLEKSLIIIYVNNNNEIKKNILTKLVNNSWNCIWEENNMLYKDIESLIINIMIKNNYKKLY